MSKKLFVGNLNFRTTEEDLAQFVNDAGHAVTEVKIITDRESGRSKGFGFVTLDDNEELAKAIGNLNGAELDGRALTVNQAKPMVQREKSFAGRRESRW